MTHQADSLLVRGCTRRHICLGLAGAGLIPATGAAQTTGTWPSRPVTLVMGTPPGGAIDAYARALAQQLGKVTGGNFVVDYKTGAAGNISAEYVQRAAPDGHTLWISTQAMMTINPSAYPALRWKQSDFKPIAKGIEAPLVLVTHPSVPARNLADLVKWAAAEPKAAYASYSPGTPSHFLGFQFNERFKLNLAHVPYKGAAAAQAGLLGREVDAQFDTPLAVPLVKAGRLKALAVSGGTRLPDLPNVPTVAEAGYPGVDFTFWLGLLLPAQTPPAIVQTLYDAIRSVRDDPNAMKVLAQQGQVNLTDPAAFAERIRSEYALWGEVIKRENIQVD